MIGRLQDIIQKVRLLCMSANIFQLTDAQIIDFINSYYLLDFPAQFRSLKLLDRYTFNTIRGIDTYPFDVDHYSTVQGPAFCAKKPIALYMGLYPFWGLNANWQYLQNITQGNGTAGPYIAQAQNSPIVRSVNNNPMVVTKQNNTTNFLANPAQPVFPQPNINRVQNLLITANVGLGVTLNVTDDGAGNLIGDCVSGTIDYETAQISNLIFTQAIPGGANIQLQYNPVQLNIPLAIMFFQQNFTVRPVPDRGYTIEMQAYRLPSQVLMGTDSVTNPNMDGRPELIEWWECLAFGAAKKFYQNQRDPEGVAEMDAYLKEALSNAETRTYTQIGSQQMQTMFRGQLNGCGGYSNFYGTPNSGT